MPPASGLNGAEVLKLTDEVADAFAALDRRWAPQILVLLSRRPARFIEIARAVPGLSKRMAGERLRELADAGLVERTVDPGPPITTTYALTADGEALRPALEELCSWAKRRGRRTA